ncbi:TIM barrel protein [Limnobacter humi]|uniref:TIM barrel protein n=1 Tax=Limnobacter humi TaxID=1778671 RepID=A0ABT1WE57_9BURK|nr:TIM barrel protein [Limnobacter humi]MCQ8895664.1 TIM barrel protein [Limnobacter humi]
MKLAANLSLMYSEWAFEDRIQAAAEDGFEWVECMFPYEVSADRLARRARQHQVRWALINAPAGNWAAGDRGLAVFANRRVEFRQAIQQAVDYAECLDVGLVHVLAGALPAQASDAQWAEARACYRENLDWLLKNTEHCPDITWLVEPINTRDVPGYLLTTQEEAHALVQTFNSPRLKVQMDLYHCQIMQGDVIKRLQAHLPSGRVGHIQIAGVPERHEPSLSELDYTRVFEVLHALGYSGRIGCEYRPMAGTRAGLAWIQRMPFSGTMGAFQTPHAEAPTPRGPHG